MNKKGAEMTIGTIVIIVLAVLVLVFLVFGFSQGWGNLADKIFNFGGSPNVDTIRSACAVACSTNAQYEYCSHKRDLVLEDKTKYQDVTCKQLETGVSASGNDVCNLGDVTIPLSILGPSDCNGQVRVSDDGLKCVRNVGGTVLFEFDESITIAKCTGNLKFIPKSGNIPQILSEICTNFDC